MADQLITKQELIEAQKDVKNAGEAVNTKKVITPRYGDPFKSIPLVVEEGEQKTDAAVAVLNAKANEVVAKGFYTGYATETELKASLPNVSEMRARADDTRKIWRWNRSSAEGVTPVTGTWTDTGPSDVDQAVEGFLEEAERIGITQQQLQNYYSFLQGQMANLSSEKNWVASLVVDASGKTQQRLNDTFKNRTVYFEDYVSDSTGAIDVTAEMQSLLDSHGGDIYAKETSVFKTSKTLFNRKHNRTIDFHNAKIVNKANSMYAIVTISPSFTAITDAELIIFIKQRHYGEEVKSSHLKNIRYEMSENSLAGANLGVGIVYGYQCKASKLYPISTNGNGFEIRNSLRCYLYDSEIYGHKNYACFIFMSQRCEIIGNKFKGGTRGVCTKMNRDGDPYCGHIIAFNNFEDATNNGRAIIAGEWRETTLTDEIYVSGHEWVDGNEIYGNTFNGIAQPQTISAACFSRNWKIYDNTFKWNNLQGTWINFGGEGNVIEGEKLGGNHEVYGNHLGGGDVKFLAGSGVDTVIANLVLAGSIEKLSGRKIEISAPIAAYGLQIQTGVTVSAKHEGNTYTLSGTATTARAVVNNAELTDGVNTYAGPWSAKVFNSYSKPVALLNIDRQWSAVPTTGNYNKGDFVRNTNPNIVANSIVFGWLRITTGSSHILNTDWVEIKQSIV